MEKITPDDISRLRGLALANDNKVLNKAINFIEYVNTSPYLSTYISLRLQMDMFNEDIVESPEGISDSKDEKRFERVMAYMKEAKQLISDIESIRVRLLPDEQITAVKKYASVADEARDRVKNKRQEKDVL